MNEIQKTLSLLGVGAVLLIGSIWAQPSVTNAPIDEMKGQLLFKTMTDPTAASSMEITTYNEKVGHKKSFKVQRIGGKWSLPSHDGYPADAKEQVQAAATSLVDLKVLDVVSKEKSQHETYGVIDPDDAATGASGVGKLVVIKNSADEALTKLVIGKETKSVGTAGGGDEGLRYVRVQGQEPVYLVKLAADKFVGKFHDWIETDLLKLTANEIKEVEINDYISDVTETRQLGMLRRGNIQLTFNDQKSEWSLKKLLAYKENKPEEIKLTPVQELNAIKLNEMKTALDDLRIIDVSRKPEGLTKYLRHDKDAKLTRNEKDELEGRGYFLAMKQDGVPTLISKHGEVQVQMKDGVEYALRFGETLPQIEDEEKSGDQKDKAATDANSVAVLNRYILVEARFNKDLIAKPDLLPLPEAKPAAEKSASDDKTKGDASKAAAPKDAASKTENKTTPPAKPGDKVPAVPGASKSSSLDKNPTANPVRLVAFQNPDAKKPATDAKKPADPVKSKADDKPADKAATDKAKETTDAKEPDDAKSGEAAPDKSNEDLELDRKRVQLQNDEKQKEYDNKVKAGEARAKELNNRFAEWFYIISDDVYKKIHLSKEDIIQVKKPPMGNAAPGGLNPLDALKGLPKQFGQ